MWGGLFILTCSSCSRAAVGAGSQFCGRRVSLVYRASTFSFLTSLAPLNISRIPRHPSQRSVEDFQGKIVAWKGEGEGKDEGKAADGNRGYLRTGDLGFIHDGELFVCGRIKDLVIIRGRNHYPQDLEACVEMNEEIRPGCSAAFSVPGGSEEVLVIVAELRGTVKKAAAAKVAADVRTRVTEDHGVVPQQVILIEQVRIL